MDEEVINDLYSRAKSKGYSKSREDFVKLLHNDSEVINDSYSYVKSKGYGKDINSFYNLIGKVETEPSTQKKKFVSDSSLEDGSSELPKSTKPLSDMPTLDQQGLESAMAKRQSAPTDMSGTTIFKTDVKAKKTFERLAKENQKLSAEKKKYGDIFDKQLTTKPKAEESQYLKDRLSSIDTDLINKTEESVVPELEYQFGDLGFKFEETGALGDYVKVTAPNGKTSEISLDNLFSSKSKVQSEILQKFIKENAPAKGLFVLEKTMREQDKKFNSQKQVDESIKGITDDVNVLNAKQKQYIAKKSQFDKELNILGPNATKEQLDLLDQQRIALNDEMKSLLKEEEKIKQKSGRLSSAVGKYTINKSKQGGWFGGIQDAIARGQGKISAGTSNLMIDIIAETNSNEKMVAPEELKKQTLIAAKKLNIQGPAEGQSYKQWRESLSEDENDDIEDEIDDFVKKSMKSNTLPYIRIGAEEIFGDPETTKQWGDLKKQDFWGGAVLGLAESAPAMIGGAGPAGWAQRTAQMYAQVSDGLAEEMESNPEFKDVSENEKLAITLPIGITGAILEEFGLRNIKGSQGLINSLTLKALGKAGKGVTAKTFRELVENEVESAIARGAITITAAGAAEFETGAAQELADTSYKALYNEIKGKEMFDTPDSVQDLIENVAVAGAQEAVGGFILGVPTGVSVAYSEKGFLKMDDASFETFANMANDDKMQSAYIASLKNKIAQGELSVSEAKDQLNNYRNSVGLFRQLPDGLTTQEKKEAMNLLKEKRDLENYIEGKDSALVVKQKNRIAEINDSLTKLSETNAVQEQSTTEIPVQSETGVSETMEGRTPEAKPEVITEPSAQGEVTQTIIENIKNDFENNNLNNIELTPTREGFDGDFLNDYEFLAQGSEHTVYRSKDGKTVIKIGEPYGSNDGFMPRVEDAISINNLIGDNSLELIGYYEYNGVTNPVYQQNYIDGTTLTQEEAAAHLESKGFTNLGNDKFAIKVGDKIFEISDTSDNFIRDNNGNISAIDAGIREINESDLTESQKQKVAEPEVLAEQVAEETQAEVTAPQTIIEEQAPVEAAAPVVEEAPVVETQQLNEKDLPGYDRTMSEVEGIVQKSKQRKVSGPKMLDNVMSYVTGSKIYEDATDVQREALVRDIRKRFGLKEKAAPSVNKLFGKIKDVTKVTMSEKTALIKQIKDRAKGARESVQAWKKQSEEFAKELNDLVKAGKITNTQVGIILKRFSKVNIFSEKSMNRFTDYMVKVFNDSNYKNKLTKARDVLSSLKKLSKDQTKNADLRAVASEFIKIDPSFVENIDEYNDIANKLKTAVDGSKIRKSTTKFAETVNAEDVISYVEKTLVDQESKIREESIQELQDLFGVDASEFSAEEINTLLESDKDISKDDEKIVRASIKKAFDIYSTVIKEMLSTGLDPFTEEDITFTKEQKELIERFMKIDPDKITDAKEALRAVDSLINFIQNKSTAGMLKSIAQYEGIEGGEQAVSEGLKATRLRKYWSTRLGLGLGEQITSLPVLFDKMFKGVTRALRVEELIGMSDLINNSSKKESESNRIVKEYVNKFYKTKANGESFNSAYNDIERGVFAHIFRNVIGPESRMKEVFSKRKQEVLDAIDLLSKRGNDSEKEIAQLLQKVYDKILDGSENIQDVIGKTDANNVKAVEHWVKEWSNKYDSLADLAINFYNKVLGRDLNYTPDKIKKLQDKMQDIDLEDIQSQFFANTDEILYDKKSGSLMDKQENRSIPKDMYVDFSFDKKNANAMNDALADLYTAFDVAKVGSFLKSKEFRKVFPSAKDANLIDKRIKKFVRLTRKKTPFTNQDISNLLKAANKLAKLGVAASLASPAQPFKQTIPVMFSTAMSAGSVGLGIAFNKNFNNWLDNLGFAISNRGVEAQAEIESLNKLLEKAADMPLDKALKFIERTNDKALKALLVNFDVWIARASFKAYYEQYLKNKGLYETTETVQTESGERTVIEKGIDYSKHEVNKEAANYAQRMVDRQQNISNPELAGDLFTSEDAAKKAFVKMLMPFSSFRTNQSARLGADLSTLEYWNTSTKEDKVIALRSIAGYVLEAAAYRSLQIGFALLTYSAAKAIMGADDEEEDKKYVENLLTGSGQSFMTDTFSPIPLADPFMQDAMAFSAEEIQSLMEIPEEERKRLFPSQEQSALKIFGTYGIPLQKAKDIYSLGRLAYTQKYTDKYGKEKQISKEESDKLKILIGPLFAASVMGVGSPDMTSIANKSIKMAKKSNKIDMELLKKTNPELYERFKKLQAKGLDKKFQAELEERRKRMEERLKKKIEERAKKN